MKRVLVIAPYSYLPHYSGGQKLIAEFLEYLGAQTQLTVISTKKNEEKLAKGYRLLRWLINPSLRYLDLRLYARINRLVETESFDCIIWEHPYYYWLARMIQNKHAIFTIIHTHNIEYQRFRSLGKWWWPILKQYEGACLKMADHVYFISPSDLESGVDQWNLKRNKCDVLPFGIRQQQHPIDREACRRLLQERHQIPESAKILLFNGLLSYTPNLQAVDDLIREVNPRLMQSAGFEYRLLICGKDLPAAYNELAAERNRNVIFAGFVDDIETYFKGADVFLNPVRSGGGIKTKMVEAIGFGTTVVSTITGSTGILREVCGEKLKCIEDTDWTGFSQCIVQEATKHTLTPAAYYAQYHWGNIVEQIPKLLADQPSR